VLFNGSTANIGGHVKAPHDLGKNWCANQVFWERQLHMWTDHFASNRSMKKT
jgi:hypothetical protein